MCLTVRAATLIRFDFAWYLFMAIYTLHVQGLIGNLSSHVFDPVVNIWLVSYIFQVISSQPVLYYDRCKACIVGLPWYICSPAIASSPLACLYNFKSVSCCRGYIASFQSFTFVHKIVQCVSGSTRISLAYILYFSITSEVYISLIFSPYAESLLV